MAGETPPHTLQLRVTGRGEALADNFGTSNHSKTSFFCENRVFFYFL
jgi:hypothetical protein